MRISSSALWVVTSTATSARAAQCTAPPVNLPIRSLAITPGAVTHGIPIYVGTPYQSIALTPSLQLDNTFLPRYTGSCVYDGSAPIPSNDTRWAGQDAREVCAELYGGGFNTNLSRTFHDNGTNDQVREGWLKKVGFADWHYVTESFVFADYVEAYVEWNKALPEKRNATTTFILPDHDATFGGMDVSALSLAPNSSLLKTLHAREMIPSLSWSLTNESLCLGCFDNNAHSGNFHAFKPADRNKAGGLPCILQTNVEALVLHSNASTEGVPLIKKPFNACIDPGITSLVLPADARNALPDTLNGSVEASSNITTILAIRLEGGLQVNITLSSASTPNSNTTTHPLFTSGQHGAYGPSIPVLGKPFTDFTVLRWDSSALEFSLAPLSPESKPTDLYPLGCTSFPTWHRSNARTPSAGIIAGSLLGGFFAGLVFASACAFFFLRGRQGVVRKYEPMRAEDTVSLRTVSSARTLETFASPAPSWREAVGAQWAAVKGRERAREGAGLGIAGLGGGPHLVEDGQLFEAPEGGTAWPSKRTRGEMFGGGR